jgi:hypothetical protein
MHRSISLVLAMTAFAWASSAFGQHGDVEFSYQSDKIQVEPGSEGFVFEGAFGEGLLSPNEAEDPGFASETVEGLGIKPDDIIAFNVLDHLYGVGAPPRLKLPLSENLTYVGVVDRSAIKTF